MSKIDERTLARGRRLDPDKDLARAAADFYILEALANLRADAWAVQRLAEHERTLAAEFAEYLDMAIGGELRYAKRYLDELPSELAPYFSEVSETGRGKAWLVWGVIRRKFGLDALAIAERCFYQSGWRRNFGGEAWGYCARALRAYLEGQRTPRIFVDQCFNLQHNTGSVFNKLYNCSDLPPVLQAHGMDDYGTLLNACSTEVRKRWSWYEWQKRAERDPVWLGVQNLQTFDEVA